MNGTVPNPCKIASDFSIDRFFRKESAPPTENQRVSAEKSLMADFEPEEEVDLQMIIGKKPKPKVVREFCKAALSQIKSEDEILFA